MDLSRDTALVGAESKDPGGSYLTDAARSFLIAKPEGRIFPREQRSGGLQPTLTTCQPRSFNPVGCAELVNRLRQIIAHRTFRQMKIHRNLRAGFTLTRPPQNLALPFAQRIRLLRPSLGREFRINHPQPTADAPYTFRQLSCRTVLQHVTLCPGIHRAAQIAGAGKGSQNHNMNPRITAMDLRRKRKPAHLRHLNISHQNVRLMLRHQRHSLSPIPPACHHGNVFLNFEQSSECPQHHRLVFRQHDTNLFTHDPATPSFSLSRGNSMRRQVPRCDSNERLPPSSWTRSRMPSSPFSYCLISPRPSSTIINFVLSFSVNTSIEHSLAPAWRTMLVTASRSTSESVASCRGVSVGAVAGRFNRTPAVSSTWPARVNSEAKPSER